MIEPIHDLRRVLLATVACAVVTAAVAAAAVASQAKSVPCVGTPVKFMVITSLGAGAGLNELSVPAGAQAAAAALTRSCQVGVPVRVVVCDDRLNASDAGACARQAVETKVVAALTYGGFGDSIVPVLAAAGIPVLNNASSSVENSNPLSFPLRYPIPALIGEVTLLATLGVTNIALPIIDSPLYTVFADLATTAASGYGVKATVIRVSPATSDLAPIATQIVAAKADGVIPVGDQAYVLSLLRSFKQQGIDLKKVRFAGDLGGLSAAFVAQAGAGNMNGIVAGGTAWSPTDSANPAIKQYISELRTAKKNTNAASLSTLGVTYWAAMHLVGDALKRSIPTSANLVKGLNTKGRIDATKYGLPPIDFTTPAFPKNTILNKLRLFTKYSSVWEFDGKGTPHALVNRWVDVTRKIKGLG